MSGGSGFLSEKLVVREIVARGQKGVFARLAVVQGELLVAWGGSLVRRNELPHASTPAAMHGIQIEDDLFMLSEQVSPSDYVNHSCAPNAGLVGQIVLVAMRDIAIDEQICFDYAMSDGCDYDEFVCGCGTASCRGQITGNDWAITALWDRYAGYFSPYLQRRIDTLRGTAQRADRWAIATTPQQGQPVPSSNP